MGNDLIWTTLVDYGGHTNFGRLASIIPICALPGCRWYFVFKNTVHDDPLFAFVSPSLQCLSVIYFWAA